jgi:hypothetical protein
MAASGKHPTTDEMVRGLWDRQQIGDVMLRFGRGLDLHDWDMYAATLTDPFDVDFFGDDDSADLGAVRQRLSRTADRHASILQLPH